MNAPLFTRTAPRAIAQTLLLRPIKRKEMIQLAIILAGNSHTGRVALKRLEDRGFIECIYQLTPAGQAALRKRDRTRRGP